MPQRTNYSRYWMLCRLITRMKSPEETEIIDNPGNMSALTLEAHVHFVDQGTTHTKQLETSKKRKKSEESTSITWKCNVSPHS